MAESPASPPQSATTTAATTKLTDLDEDALAHCATYLSLQDLSNLAMTSKFLKKVAYSDSIWLHRFRERWPLEMLSSSSTGARKAYLDWRTALHQFKFADPFGDCQRCFRGHNGAVSTLSDKLLGDGGSKVLASGGEDGTVRLWSLSSSGKRGQQALKATLYGHQKPVTLMSVAGHKTSLLVTMSKDSKVRVWDTTTSSAIRSSCCVGMTSVPGVPVDLRCHEALLYVAAGSSVVIVDLRTMQKVNTAAVFQPKLYSLAVMPSKSLICTGGFGKAMLWDIRRGQGTSKPEPVTELDGHMGSVTQLYMDPYKIVTGGLGDNFVNIWETDTGRKTNSLLCNHPELGSTNVGCSAMAVNACRIVTASYGETQGLIRFRDFSTATYPVTECDEEEEDSSKFWGSLWSGTKRYLWIDLGAGPVDYGPALSGDGVLPRGEFHPLAALHGRPKSEKTLLSELASLIYSAYQVLVVPPLRIPVHFENTLTVQLIHVHASETKDLVGLDWNKIEKSFRDEANDGGLLIANQTLEFKRYSVRYEECSICSFAVSRSINSYTSRFLFDNYTLIVSEYLDSKRLHQILSDSAEEFRRVAGLPEEEFSSRSMWGVSPTHLLWSPTHNSTLVDYTWSVGQTPFGPFSEISSLSFVQKDAARRNFLLTSLNYSITSAIDVLESVDAHGGDRNLLKQNQHVEFIQRWHLFKYKLDKVVSALSHFDFEMAFYYLKSSDHDLYAMHNLVYTASQEIEASLVCFKDPPFPWASVSFSAVGFLALSYVYAKRDKLFRNKRKQF
ncbi:hypothetical protein COLO4_25162 [Corchorus olitorius]|uniref:Uncharacterized protein n=1 Tax=Corchorus olitorius TaxID=93759 RepID=A0A1R3I4B7_9ROSI|nr:hypothetical protein COLO4_25162 [Corchorus olitorius]